MPRSFGEPLRDDGRHAGTGRRQIDEDLARSFRCEIPFAAERHGLHDRRRRQAHENDRAPSTPTSAGDAATVRAASRRAA